MVHEELVLVALGVHAAALVGAVAAYYRYGDRTELFARSLHGMESMVRQMRQQIGADLEDRLRPIFENPGAMRPPILGQDGNTYIEQAANPVGSEGYREAVREFVEKQAGTISDFRSLLLAKAAWCFWARFLSWAILGFLTWQLAAVGALAFLDRIGGLALPEWSIKWSALPTSLCVLACLVPLPMLLRNHDRVTDYKQRYEEV